MISLKQRKEQGFTIVELLIVIVVIGILAGLVITTYNGIQQKARNTERTTDLKTFQSQLEAYYANNGAYPGPDSLGTTSATNVTFIKASMKGMDSETLRDPKGTAADYSLITTATSTSTKYGYAPTNDAGTACTTAASDCTKYVLTAAQEGSSTITTLNSLN
jgi:prepilin-type N-terminal cleavage/methylation domain-containing protein